ncbi:MAG: acetyl-CoA C-acetyltransferase [Candidatus Thiodiazotropha endolucinida]|nr:acetyl-CoA C-acetyltransferase [Candidatus Thiodiazotropha taylori]MCG8055174.1 acetyl-CoA C-acetyltransferase [Candidatus Thiodiazotropha taylori]MCW4313662.1 acetyl-CoA C-acetyltransferase [Candidatus Thiodiazotropha taylori]MCW4317002.1 acetyl-CoA C-acetyltransferase [Candidatus Thiodiazotropha taylori]
MVKDHYVARNVFVVDGSRTPFLKARGKPGPFRASDLAVSAARPLLTRQSFAATELDEVIVGCIAPGPDEANIARIIALRLGCGDKVPAWTVQRNCASGMQAIDSAALDIASGRADLVLAGGTESMSHHPILLNQAMVAWLADWNRAKSVAAKSRQLAALRPQHLQLVIALLRGLTDPLAGLTMGQTAEKLAWRFQIDRDAMDHFAVRSHQKLAEAIDAGRLDEIEPIYSNDGDLFETDDGLRRDSSVEKLANLKPAFDRPVGKVTAGNSAQITDGAAMLLLASEEAVERHNLPILGRVVDSQWSALDPTQMGLGPVHAMGSLLQRQRMDGEAIDYWEINEAFAAQVLACQTAWQDQHYMQQEVGLEQPLSAIPEERLNVDGGAISIGHPVGASGARLVLHLLKTLQQRGATRGMASLCIGGGQGGAMLLEVAK